MTIKIYTARAAGIINKEAAALEEGDILVVSKLTFPKGRKVVHLEVVKPKNTITMGEGGFPEMIKEGEAP